MSGPPPSGYDVRLVESPTPDRYKCPLCNLVLRDAIQTERAGRACLKCYTNAKKGDICPIDNEPICSKFFKDKYIQREIMHLMCYCKNSNDGCPWKGQLNSLEKHQESCTFVLVQCSQCHNDVQKSRMDEHLKNECAHRLTTCQFCSTELKAMKMEFHEVTCLQRPVKCPYDCGASPKTSEFYQHFKDCPAMSNNLICPYTLIGCDFVATDYNNLCEHLREDKNHVNLTIQTVLLLHENNEKLNRKLLEEVEKRKEIETSYTTLLKEYNIIVPKVAVWKSMKDEMTQNLDRLQKLEQLQKSGGFFADRMKSINEVNDKLAACQTQYDEVRLALNQKSNRSMDFPAMQHEIDQFKIEVDKVEMQNANLAATIADIDLKIQLLENTRYDGRQVWKINNFRFRMRQAESGRVTALHSAPCFTSREGYKFCSRLYLNGDGTGLDTHMSLFFVLMQSEYDQLLKWPFTKRVTFNLINHRKDADSHKESFVADRMSSSFQRPKKEMNIAAGCPLFISKAKLIPGMFVIDDSIFIEVTVEE